MPFPTMLRRILRLFWPFRRKQRQDMPIHLKHFSKPHKIPKKLIAGVLIGSAIAGVVGKKMMYAHKKEGEEDEETGD